MCGVIHNRQTKQHAWIEGGFIWGTLLPT
jgi:hypothetical protein